MQTQLRTNTNTTELKKPIPYMSQKKTPDEPGFGKIAPNSV